MGHLWIWGTKVCSRHLGHKMAAVPIYGKRPSKQSLIYSGPIVWNSLPATLKIVNSVSFFHNHFIKWLKH